jgi:hypothetical protein
MLGKNEVLYTVKKYMGIPFFLLDAVDHNTRGKKSFFPVVVSGS